MLNEFPKLNFEDEKPIAPPIDSRPYPFGKPPLTTQELAYEAMRKVNSIIADVVKFEERMKQEFETFIQTDAANDQSFKQTVTEAFDLFTSTVTQEVNNFQTSVTNSFELFKNGMESDYAQFTAALEKSYSAFKTDIEEGVLTFKQSVNNQINVQNENLNAAIASMTSNIEETTRIIFEQKVQDGTISDIVVECFGNNSVYKGSSTVAEIVATNGAANGDVWYAHDEGVYYQYTQAGWINIGAGDKSYAEVMASRGNYDTLNARLDGERGVQEGYCSLGYNYVCDFGDNSVTITGKNNIVCICNGKRYSLESDNLLTDLPNNVIDDGTNYVVSFDTDGQSLVYNLHDNKFYIRNYANLLPDDIHLYTAYNSNGGGRLADNFAFQTALTSKKAILNHSFYVTGRSRSYPRLDYSSEDYTAIIELGTGFHLQSPVDRKTFTAEELVTALPDNASLDENGNVTIRIGSNKWLWYDHITKTIGINSIGNGRAGYIPLYLSYWNNDCGLLFDAAMTKYVEYRKDDITAAYKSTDSWVQIHSGNTNRITVKRVDNIVYLSFADGFYVHHGDARISFYVADVLAALPDDCTLDETTNIITIAIPSTKALKFNVTDNTLSIGAVTARDTSHITLYANYYENDYGLMYERMLDNYVWDEKMAVEFVVEDDVAEFNALCSVDGDTSSFVYFTDPHTGGDEAIQNDLISRVKKVYDNSATSFVVCGGDWINSGDTVPEACSILNSINKKMAKNFDSYYLVVGNHDTNYQGRLDSSSENWTGTLSNNAIRNLWYREQGKSYYSFDDGTTTYYVLDTQLDSVDAMTNYKWEQIEWLGNRLLNDVPKHAAIFMHIALNASSDTVGTMASHVATLIKAFNDKSAVTIGDYGFDFRTKTGRVEFIVAGHTHTDEITTLGDVPCIITDRTIRDGTFTIDMLHVNYTTRIINIIRTGGNGENRTVSL